MSAKEPRAAKIGFIGLGVMGRPMAKNLLKAGYEVVVHDLNPEPVEELCSLGAQSADSGEAVAGQVAKLILMLPDSPEVEQVMLGRNGVLAGAETGLLVIDMSSISPIASRRIALAAADKGVRYIEAPVSGGEPGAIAGTLSIMAGGSPRDFAEARPILEKLGKSVVLAGEIGAGNTVKLANQIMVALNIAAMSEALVLAAKAGVDPKAVYEAVRGGLAGSNVLDTKAPLILQRKFDPGFRINLHLKDLKNVLEAAHSLDVPLPLTASVMELMRVMKAAGEGDLDHGGLVRLYERMAGVEVRPMDAHS